MGPYAQQPRLPSPNSPFFLFLPSAHYPSFELHKQATHCLDFPSSVASLQLPTRRPHCLFDPFIVTLLYLLINMAHSSAPYPISSSYNSPSSFGLFTVPSSPRETHFMMEDFRAALRPNGPNTERKRTVSGSSMKAGLKKFFGVV